MNVQKYFEIKKRSAVKEEKTRAKAEEAIKMAETNAKKQLDKMQSMKKRFDQVRKPFWFEKFDWFISSENYLVVSGRNVQQNEQVCRDYLGKLDVYVHADIHGAGSVVILNPTQ